MLSRDTILKAFDRINVWSRGSERAPHKPLLVLYRPRAAFTRRTERDCVSRRRTEVDGTAQGIRPITEVLSPRVSVLATAE